MQANKYVMTDPPSCEFLKKNVKAEMEAIEGYSEESGRTDDPVWKEAIMSLAKDEMRHHELLTGAAAKLGCRIE